MFNRVKIFIVSAALVASFVDEGSAQAPKLDEAACVSLAATIASSTGAQFDRWSPSRTSIFMRHPATKSFRIGCDSRILAIDVDQPIPGSDFYLLLDRTSVIMFGARSGQGRALAESCYKTALSDKELLMAEVGDRNLSIDCNVVLRGEGGVFMGVSARTQ